jgi:outer membrane biogenesis lipoprotein LolB
MIKQSILICGVAIFLLFGCASLKDSATIKPLQPVPKPGTEIAPGSVLAVLKQINSGLTSFKGIGKIKIWSPEGLKSTRIVWAGDETQKMRIEILGLGGRPFSSVVYDGNYLSVSLHSEGRFYQKQTRQADLKRLISLPLTVQDAHTILAGRVPVLENAALTMERDPSGNQHVLILSKGWFRKQTGKIYLREDMKTVWKYELFQGEDTLLYRVEFLSRKQYGDYQIPNVLVFSNDLQTRLRIDVDSIWPDVNLSPSVFILKPPG